MSREDLGVHSPVIPAAATEGILETLIRGGVMQHVEMGSGEGEAAGFLTSVKCALSSLPTFLNRETKVKWWA